MTELNWRPTTLDRFVGQRELRQELAVELQAARSRHRPLNHAIFGGPGGLGKTTLAKILAKERGSECKMVPNATTHEKFSMELLDIDSPGYDDSGRLVNPSVATFPVFILDECEKLKRADLEILHPLLEPVGDGGRLIFEASHPETGELRKVWVKQCTFIFITNYVGELVAKSPATFTRVPIQRTFQWYSPQEIAAVLDVYRKEVGLAVDDDAIPAVARRANGIPRVGINLLRRALDFAIVAGSDRISNSVVEKMFSILGIDENGLDRAMLSYLRVLSQAHGRLGLQAIMGILGEDEATVVKMVEPVLMRKGMILRSSAGRTITQLGRAVLKKAGGESDPFFAQSTPV